MALDTKEFISKQEIVLELPFNEENSIRQLISNIDGELIASDYNSMVTITALLPRSKVAELESSLGSMISFIK